MPPFRSIQVKLLGLMVFLVVVVTSLGAVASFWVTLTEHRGLAQQRLQENLHLLRNELDRLGQELERSAAALTLDDDLIFKMQSRNDLEGNLGAKELTYGLQSKLVQELGRIASSMDFDIAALYGHEGLLGYTTPQGLRIFSRPEDSSAMIAYAPSGPSALVRFSSASWQPADPLPGAPPSHLPLEKESLRWFDEDDNLVVSALAPIRATAMDSQSLELMPLTVGAVLFKKVLDQTYIREFTERTGIRVNIFKPDGTTYACSTGESPAKLSLKAHLQDGNARFSTVEIENTQYFMLAEPYRPKDGQAVAALATYLPRAPLVRNSTSIIRLQIGGLLCGLLLAASIAVLAGRSVIRPLVSMAAEMKDISASKRFKRRVEVSTRDEIGQLATTFNEMMAELDDAYTALVGAEERYRGIFENAIAGLFQILPDGQAVVVNQALARILGYESPEELIAQGWNLQRGDIFVDPENRLAILNKIMRLEAVKGFETKLYRKDKSSVMVSLNAHPVLDKAGKLLLVEGSLMDISERKAKEQAEKEREKAQAATQAKSEFLARMSHEIRTPLNVVIGLTELALKTELNLKQFDYLVKVSSAAKNLLAIINDIIDFSKIEARKLEIEKVEFSLDEVLENVSGLLGMQAEKKDLELLFDIAPDVPLRMLGDPLRLGQVLTNLGANAVKFTESGSVVLGAKRATPEEPLGRDTLELLFFVKDTGIGLTPKQAENLFQPFQQADTSTTRKFGGTGLGLSICKSIVEMMHGRIWLESEPGMGSTFYFTARLGRLPESEDFHCAGPLELQGLKALVVDDNHIVRNVIREYLENLCFTVLEASSGEEALEMVEKTQGKERFDLVLLDWKMPEMDGIETARRMRALQGASETPAMLMVTAYGREEIKKQAEQTGIKGFLAKPVNPSSLNDAIMNLLGLEGRRFSRPEQHQCLDAESLRPIRGARVLLVEDNELNQQVAVEHLRLAGLHVNIANNGLEGLRMATQETYDLVLMDIQMPEMDGYEATRRIRRHEEQEGCERTPIAAMTAHALANERERCLGAGMDGYISKPFDPDQFFAVLLRLIKPGRREAPPPTRGGAGFEQEAFVPENLPGLDLCKALKLLGGNRAIFVTILHKFAADYGSSAETLRRFLDDGNLQEAHRLAHTVKGLAGNLGSTDLRHAALALEEALEDAMAATGEEQPAEVPRGIMTLLPAYEAALDDIRRAASLCTLSPPASSPRTPEPDAEEKDSGEALDAIRKLAEMVAKSDMESLDFFMEQKGTLTASPLGGHLAEIEKLLTDYDLEEAHALLRRVVEGKDSEG